MKSINKLLKNKYVKRYGRFMAAGLLVVVVGVAAVVISYRHNHQQTPQASTVSQTSNVNTSTPNTDTQATPQTVEQAFPNAQELTLNQSHTDGALSYQLTGLQTSYSDTKYNNENSSLNPYSGQGIPGADATPSTFTLATIKFTNNTGRTACENVLTTCPDGGPKYDFGCVFTSDKTAAKLSPNATTGLDNMAENDFVFSPHLIEPTTYPNTSLLDKGSVIYNGGTYSETIELTSSCTAFGNATGNVYWKIN